MIYTVECHYTDPASENEWNDFYSRDKLPALIAVPGFLTSQRFKALSANTPRYLALHTIEAAGVLDGEAYRRNGGGNFAKWQPHIADWYRNLYRSAGPAPAIGEQARLALSTQGPAPLIARGLAVLALEAVGLAYAPAQRWLAVVDRDADIAALTQAVIPLYAPMTAQLTGAGTGNRCDA